MAEKKKGADWIHRWQDMKQPSSKLVDGEWHGRNSYSLRVFEKYHDDVWRCIVAAREHLDPGLCCPDQLVINQYFATPKVLIANHFDPQDTQGEAIVGVNLGATCELVMKRCAIGHSRCGCKAPLTEKRVLLRRGYISDESRRRRGWDVDNPWR